MFSHGGPILEALNFSKLRNRQSKMVCSSLPCFCCFNFISSGPMMKLVYKLQAEDYKFDFPVSYLPVSKPWGESRARAEHPAQRLRPWGRRAGLEGLRQWARHHGVCSGPRGRGT